MGTVMDEPCDALAAPTRNVRCGVTALMVKVAPLDGPPPGVGLKTVTLAVPAVAMSAAVIAAVSCVLLPKVVIRSDPFKRTFDPFTKFVPLTVSVKFAPPAVAEFGLRLVIVGTRLLTAKLPL